MVYHITYPGASYHHNRRSGRHDRELRDRDRERDRMERDGGVGGPMDRDRDRLHARERDLVQYDLNEDDLLNERSYGGEYLNRDRHDRGMDRGDPRLERLERIERGSERLLERGERIIDRGDRMLEPERIRTLERGDRPLIHRGGSGHCEESELLRDRESSRYGDRSVPQSVGGRRDREEYSPHRGGGNNRRVLNAM